MMRAELEPDCLAKQKKAIDLCLAACQKRQSPRTRFVHYFYDGEEYTDTIPLYENFCFAIALYRQKTVESALEGKALLEKLLAFQAADGNFPIYLHEFPCCYDRMQGLKIAPLLLQLQRRFSSVLSLELKQKLSVAVTNILESYQEPLTGVWQYRYEMCKYGKFSTIPLARSAADWGDLLISAQLGSEMQISLSHFFHPELQVFFDPSFAQPQEGFEPKPHLIEWLMAEKAGAFSSRLLRGHPLQMQLASLWPLPEEKAEVKTENACVLNERDKLATWRAFSDQDGDAFRLFWGKKTLSSLVLPSLVPTRISPLGKREWEILFDLPEGADQTHNDLFEALFYCTDSPDLEILINGQKGTTFSLNDQIEIITPSFKANLYFELISGSGNFRGHLSKANRRLQTKAKHYEVYDWQIGLRTLRRSSKAVIRSVFSILESFPVLI